MNHIREAILNYLTMKTTGALFLTGEWGSGKTFYIKNNVLPVVEKETAFVPVIISLYGETDKNNIAQKVLFSFFDKKGEKVKLSTGTIAKNISALSKGIPILRKYIDIDKLIVGTGENAFQFLPRDNLLICFDDIERISKKININDFLGIVNELVENKGCKVLLIANEEPISEKIEYKEKTIERTLYFSPDISSILASIVKSYDKEIEFRKYLNDDFDFILKSLDYKIDDIEESKDLKKSFSNIRNIKFAIEHFKYPFKALLASNRKLSDELILRQLRNLWTFTLAISIEFRKPESITFTDRKNLDSEVITIDDLDLNTLDLSNSFNKRDGKSESEWDYLNNFKKLYFRRLSESYVFYPEIYDLITSGKAINQEDFLAQIDSIIKTYEGKVNPGYNILSRILNFGYWSFTNEEFEDALNDLLTFSEKGQLEGIVSYLNAGTYLIRFNDLIDIEKEVIVYKLKQGLGLYLSSIKSIDSAKNELELVSEQYNDSNLQSVISFVSDKIVEIEEENKIKEVKNLENLLSSDIKAFIENFLPDDSGVRFPDVPIFHKINPLVIRSAIGNFQPNEIVELHNLLKRRYLNTSFGNFLTDELIFLKNLKEGIKDINVEEKKLSNKIIKSQLLPRIDECIERLSQYIPRKE